MATVTTGIRLARAATDTIVGALVAAGAMVSLLLFLLTSYFTALCVLGIGFVALPLLTRAVRWYCGLARAVAARAGVPVETPYREGPSEVEPDIVGWMRVCKWILTDPATWRDLLFLGVNAVVGFAGFLPAAVLYYAGEGLVLAAGLWRPLAADGDGRWYAFVTVDSWPAAVAVAGIAVGLLAVWVVTGPAVLRAYAHFLRALLGPSQRDILTERVRNLDQARTGALDNQAVELRRIERDLHDGAQARLVALGLELGAVDRQLDRDPEQARQMLREARSSSLLALRELRDLVRGIVPPVLAERGLADAIRSLGMSCPLPVMVLVDVPDGVPAPVESATYFGVSELLANALKHADASTLEIAVGYHRGVLRARVTDDGKGGADPDAGTGLQGVRSRLATLDATLTITSPPGGPTVMQMEMPCVLSSPRTSSS